MTLEDLKDEGYKVAAGPFDSMEDAKEEYEAADDVEDIRYLQVDDDDNYYVFMHESATALAYVSRIYEKLVVKGRLKEPSVKATSLSEDISITPISADDIDWDTPVPDQWSLDYLPGSKELIVEGPRTPGGRWGRVYSRRNVDWSLEEFEAIVKKFKGRVKILDGVDDAWYGHVWEDPVPYFKETLGPKERVDTDEYRG